MPLVLCLNVCAGSAMVSTVYMSAVGLDTLEEEKEKARFFAQLEAGASSTIDYSKLNRELDSTSSTPANNYRYVSSYAVLHPLSTTKYFNSLYFATVSSCVSIVHCVHSPVTKNCSNTEKVPVLDFLLAVRSQT